jgi:hypothetical protein
MKKLIPLFFVLVSNSVFAQFKFEFYDSIQVVQNNDTLKLSWAGGFNSPQFSEIDLNFDGKMDLLAFEREGNVIKPFIYDTTISDYVFAPQYKQYFPTEIINFMLMRDYNCDGKSDLFAYGIGGLKVYQNVSDTVLKFRKVSNLLLSNYGSAQKPSMINIYVSPTDIPAIDDIDGDGDLDVLSFNVFGNHIEYHQNMSMDSLGNCDSLYFIAKDACWGKVVENSVNNNVTLNISCKGIVPHNNPQTPFHTGSTILSLDLDEDNDKEVILGDVSFTNFVTLINGGDSLNAHITSQFDSFPNTDKAVELFFPAGFYLDVDKDGIKDLVASANTTAGINDKKSVWMYKNSGKTNNPNLQKQTDAFLQSEMMDFGSGANPVFFDWNTDGLLDLIVGSYGSFDTNNVSGQLAVFINVGTTNSPKFQFNSYSFLVSSQNIYGVSPAFGDLDNDGDDDMIIGDADGFLHFYKNTIAVNGISNFSVEQIQFSNIDVGQFATPQIIDLNGDSLLDLVVGERAGNLNYFQNVGTKSNPKFKSTGSDSLGKVDVLKACCTGYSAPFFGKDSVNNTVLYVGSESGKIYIYNQIDGNYNGEFNLLDSIETFTHRTTLTLADINQDGKQELIFGEFAGGLGLMQQTDSVFNYPVDTVPTDTTIDSTISILQSIKSTILAYPNPVVDVMKLKVEKYENSKVMIFDIEGKMMFYSILKSSEQTINLKQFANGTYILMVQGEGGTYVTRIVKQSKQ